MTTRRELAPLAGAGGQKPSELYEEQVPSSNRPSRELPDDPRAQIVSALRSPLELKQALRLVAGIVLEATEADHVSIFLIEGGRLLPAVALRRVPSPEAWQAMKALGPIGLTRERTKAFLSGDPVLVDDVREESLVPKHIVETFSLRSMAMIAMRSEESICGVMAVGRDVVRPFCDEEVGALRSLSTHAARAVNEARPFESVRKRARLQEALARGSVALSSPLEDEEIARRLLGAFSELVDTGTCAVALVDEDQVRMTKVLARKPIEARTPIPFADIPSSLLRQVRRAWMDSGGPGPVEIDDEPWVDEVLGSGSSGVRRHLLVPLMVYEQIRGAAVLGFRDVVNLDAEERAAVCSLAAMGAAALERHVLLERLEGQVRQLETLHSLGADLAQRADPSVLLARLNEALKEVGAEAVDVAVRDRRLASHLGARRPRAEERFTGEDEHWVAGSEGSWVVPMRLDGKVVGVLRVRSGELDRPQRMFVEALGSGLAEVASRAVLREALEEEARERVLEEERMRIARDLHDTVGQRLVAIHLLAGALADGLHPGSAEETQASRVSEMAAEGKCSIDDSVRALAFVPEARKGLCASIKELAASLGRDSGIAVSVAVTGRTRRLDPLVERALYRVAHEALSNAWRHARCKRIEVELRFSASAVSLRVQDDGVGIRRRTSGDSAGMGRSSMRRAMEEVSGTLEVRDRRQRGAVVEARVENGEW